MTARRSFLARLGAAAAALGVGSSSAVAQQGGAPASSPASSSWQPAREAKDDWLDQIPGKHRMIFDATSPEGVADAIRYAGNFFTANKNGYGLENSEVAVVIVLRHRATQFAFSDEIWAKYGKIFSAEDKFTDPKSAAIPTANYYRSGLEAHVKRGVHFAVCDLSTNRLKSAIARGTDGKPETIYKELTGNAIGNAHFVAAGIVAVNRAQERGYALAHAG
jgi:intracellular sulfur oxidation DsrE/DsrF family protein